MSLSLHNYTYLLYIAPSDYIPIENEINFQPGVNEQLISLVIPILNDELQEPLESFLGEITIPGLQPRTQLGQATTTITITDDDRKCKHS